MPATVEAHSRVDSASSSFSPFFLVLESAERRSVSVRACITSASIQRPPSSSKRTSGYLTLCALQAIASIRVLLASKPRPRTNTEPQADLAGPRRPRSPRRGPGDAPPSLPTQSSVPTIHTSRSQVARSSPGGCVCSEGPEEALLGIAGSKLPLEITAQRTSTIDQLGSTALQVQQGTRTGGFRH